MVLGDAATIGQVAVLVTAVLGGLAGIVTAVASWREKRLDATDRQANVAETVRQQVEADAAEIRAEYRGLWEATKNEAIADRDRYDRELAAVRNELEDVRAGAAQAVTVLAAERDSCQRELAELRDRLDRMEGRP